MDLRRPTTARVARIEPWRAVSTLPDRARRVVPFVGVLGVALVLALLPPGEPDRFAGIGLAAIGFVCCAALIVLVPWERLPTWPRLVVLAAFCAQVGIVRDATGGSRSGFATVLLLAVLWHAVYGDRAHLAVSIAMTASTLMVPIVVVGAPRYPGTEWRKALLLALVAAVIGVVVQTLVRRIRDERGIVDVIAGLGRDTEADPLLEVCRAAVGVTDADMAVLFAVRGRALDVVASAGVELPPVSLTPDLVPPHILEAIDTRRRTGTGDVERLLGHREHGSTALGMRAWAHQPAGRTDVPTVVLSVGWRRPHRAIPHLADFALPLLAAEAAAAAERVALLTRLDAMARQDPLTGLVNRRAWDDHLDRELRKLARSGRPLSVAVLDLDRFKAFNDAHGHLVGDQLLKGAASAWTGVLRGSDVLARWGGEEFAVLMPETDGDQAAGVLARMAERTPMEQTFSAGLVTTDGPVDPSTLMQAADEAVYAAKAAGRDQVVTAAPPTSTAATDLPV